MSTQHPPAPTAEVGWWRDVETWCLGANDTFGTCSFVSIANLHVLITTVNGAPEVFSDGEIENAYSQMAHFNPLDPSTDKGEVLVDLLAWWKEKGWPADPEFRPLEVWSLTKERIREGIDTYGAVIAWCLLPVSDDEDWDFTDTALTRGVTGTGAHALLIVGAGPGVLHLVTWARIRTVSDAWWSKYGCDQYVVLHPQWKKP